MPVMSTSPGLKGAVQHSTVPGSQPRGAPLQSRPIPCGHRKTPVLTHLFLSKPPCDGRWNWPQDELGQKYLQLFEVTMELLDQTVPEDPLDLLAIGANKSPD